MHATIRVRSVAVVAAAMLLAIVCTVIVTQAWSVGAAGGQPAGVHLVGAKNGNGNMKKAPDPIGIGSHYVVLDDRVVFGDYTFESDGTGSHSIIFHGVDCTVSDPPPLIFTNSGGGQAVAVQGWSCIGTDFGVYITSEVDGIIQDIDFDWMVYRG